MVSEAQLYLGITREILKKRPDRNICFPSPRLLCFAKLYQTAVFVCKCRISRVILYQLALPSPPDFPAYCAMFSPLAPKKPLILATAGWLVCLCVWRCEGSHLLSQTHGPLTCPASTPPSLNHELLLRSMLRAFSRSANLEQWFY